MCLEYKQSFPGGGMWSTLARRWEGKMFGKEWNGWFFKRIGTWGHEIGKFCQNQWVKECDLQANELVLCNQTLYVSSVHSNGWLFHFSFLGCGNWTPSTTVDINLYISVFASYISAVPPAWPSPPTPLTDFVFVAILIENNHSQPCGEQKGKKSPDIWVCQYASGVSKHYFSFSSSLLVVVEAGAIPFLKEFTVEKNQSFEGKELINGNGVWILSFSFHVSHALLESDT